MPEPSVNSAIGRRATAPDMPRLPGRLCNTHPTGKPLLDRLKQHASSISETENLELEHFFVRHLVVDDIWIPLGENMFIETFQPVWNRVIDGFGTKIRASAAPHSTNRHGKFCTPAEGSQRSYTQEQYFADPRREPRPRQLDATTELAR